MRVMSIARSAKRVTTAELVLLRRNVQQGICAMLTISTRSLIRLELNVKSESTAQWEQILTSGVRLKPRALPTLQNKQPTVLIANLVICANTAVET